MRSLAEKCSPLSSRPKTKEGLDQLFESISMQADLLDLKANPDRLASGTVLEARQVQGKGAVATVLVQRGTLKRGDIVVAWRAVGSRALACR